MSAALTITRVTAAREETAIIKLVKNYLESSLGDERGKRVNKTARNNPMKRSLINRRFRPSGN